MRTLIILVILFVLSSPCYGQNIKNYPGKTITIEEYNKKYLYKPNYRPLKPGEYRYGSMGTIIGNHGTPKPSWIYRDYYYRDVLFPMLAEGVVVEVLKDKPYIEFTSTKERLWREKHKATLIKIGYYKKELVVVFRMADGENKAMNWEKLTVKERQYICDCVKKER